jgi:phospholipid/cholesterol/gamma-HCH transport system ATP-binding protein
MIELHDVHKRFGTQVVLDGVNFTVQDGETLALLGPSGTGKSVLLKHIVGLIHQDSGTVLVDGKDVTKLKREDLRQLRSTIGYVFQNGALFDSMTVFENIRLGITNNEHYRDMEFCRERVSRCLALVNLTPDTLEKYPAQLSGGMRKRVGISRAIAGEPKYLLYDEPTSGLDPVNSDIIDDLVKRLSTELGVTSVMDPRCARRLQGGQPAGAAHRWQDRAAGYAGRVHEIDCSGGARIPRARLRQPHLRRLSHGSPLSEGSRRRHHGARGGRHLRGRHHVAQGSQLPPGGAHRRGAVCRPQRTAAGQRRDRLRLPGRQGRRGGVQGAGQGPRPVSSRVVPGWRFTPAPPVAHRFTTTRSFSASRAAISSPRAHSSPTAPTPHSSESRPSPISTPPMNW